MNNPTRDYETEGKRAMRNLLGDENVRYWPIFAKYFGGATAGLLLSQLVYWDGRQADPDGWIRKIVSELETETGLTEREQETARALLTNAGIVEFKRKGMPARPHYRIVWDALLEQLSNPPVRTKRPNKKGRNASICEDSSSGVLLEQNVLTNSETTSKTTTQTTSKKIAANAAPLESSPQIQTQPEPEGNTQNGNASPLQQSPIDDDISRALAQTPDAPPVAPTASPRPRNVMFDKLAAMTHTTGAMAGPQIGKLIKQLKASHYDETHLDQFELWWCQDWRSKDKQGNRGIVPTVGQIGQLFGVAMAWAEKHAPKPAPIVEQLSPEDAAALEARLMAEYEAQEAERTRRRIAAGYIKA